MAKLKITNRWVEILIKKYRESCQVHLETDWRNIKRWELGIVFILSLLFSFIYYLPILSSGNNLGIQDWDQNFAWTEVNRISLIKYHQFPFWNPFKCGGSTQFGNPQIPVISIQTIFALIFGTVRGIKYSIFFHGFIGFIGFYFLARQYKLSYIGSLLAAIIFSFSGITSSFLLSGMVVLTGFAYIPYVMIFFNKGINDKKWGIISGIIFAISFYYDYHIPLLVGVFLVIYALVLAIVKRSTAPLKTFIIVFITASLLILPKLLLSYQLLRIYPIHIIDASGYSISNLLYFLLSPKQNPFNLMNVGKFSYGIDENSIYIGILPCIIFLLFFIKNKKEVRNNIPLIITMLMVLWLMLQISIGPSLYQIIHQLPLFSSFRVAQRFRFDLIIPLALIIGLGLDNFVRLFKRQKLARIMAIFLLVIIYADLTIFSTKNFLSKTLIIVNPESSLSRVVAFTQTGPNQPDFKVQRTIQIPFEYINSTSFLPKSYEYLKIIQNQGVLDCYDTITKNVEAKGIGDDKYQGEFHLLSSDDQDRVEETFWSPNKLIFKITHGKEMNNLLIINQNFYPGWVVKRDSTQCERASFYNGELAGKLDSSTESITFEYNPFEYYLFCK